MYYLYDENDHMLCSDPSPVGAELKKRDLERRYGIAVYIVREER